MSFLAGRLAGKEAAYFLEESKHAVSRLVEKTPKPPPTANATATATATDSADILPEVLRHSLPPKIFRQDQLLDSTSSISTASKWTISSPKSNIHFSSVSPDALNPLRGYLSLPQVTFGPKRWHLPTAESSVTASTANELRRDQYTQINPEKLRAAAEGLSQIGKAFAIATAIIFGSAALTFGLAASKLELHNIDDIQTKGRGIFQPKFDTIREQLGPLRDWAQITSSKWHIKNEQEIKERPIVKELSKMLGAKTSNSK